MSASSILLSALVAWIALILLIRCVIAPWLARGPLRDPMVGLEWRLARLYCRIVHRAKWIGLDDLRQSFDPGPIIVVSNHTGSVDPLLIQSGCRFHVRWLMASEMMVHSVDWIWRQQRVIPVDRDGRDSGPAREAIRHVHHGGVVGIFPEGRIVDPPRQIRPFFPGVGLIVARTKAPVLLVWISGTPDTRETFASLFRPSRARIEFLEVIDFSGERDAAAITRKIRERLSKDTAWPLNDQPMPPAERG